MEADLKEALAAARRTCPARGELSRRHYTVAQVACALGCANETVRSAMRRLEIEPREESGVIVIAQSYVPVIRANIGVGKGSGGGWTKGKRRHEQGDWQQRRLILTGLINDHFSAGVRSLSALARALGVSDRTVRRWVSGEDIPAPAMQSAIAAWIGEQQRQIKARHHAC